MDRSSATTTGARSAAGRLRPAAGRLSILVALISCTTAAANAQDVASHPSGAAAHAQGAAGESQFIGFQSTLTRTQYRSLSRFNERRTARQIARTPGAWASRVPVDAYGRPLGGQPSLLAQQPEPHWSTGGQSSAVRLTSVTQPMDAAAAQTQQPDGAKEPETYGAKPVDNTLEFLRRQSVLLKRGESQFDTGAVFTNFDFDFPVSIVGGIARADLRQRLLYTPLAYRYGLTDRVQVYTSLPVGWANGQTSIVGQSQSVNQGGLGDLNAGCNVKLREGQTCCPEVIGTFGFTAPTGVYTSPIFATVPGAGLGQGMWAINTQLLLINVYDPVVIFYGGGYRHLFEREFNSILYAAGEQFNYQMGVGFAVNERVTLSSAFQGYYITDTYINRERIQGSNIEPMTMRFAVTITRPKRIIEPFAMFGLTEFAPKASVGIVVTFY